MANPLAGLSGLGSAEVRTRAGAAPRSPSTSAAEVDPGRPRARPRGRADLRHRGPALRRRRRGARAGRASRRDMAGERQAPDRRAAVAAPGRDEGPPHRDRLPERLRLRAGPAGRREDAVQRRGRGSCPRATASGRSSPTRRTSSRSAACSPSSGRLWSCCSSWGSVWPPAPSAASWASARPSC